MKALVLCDIGHLELRSVAPPALGTHDCIVRVEAVGICGTDFLIFSGQFNHNKDEWGRPIPLRLVPQILGHEIAGVVEEVGCHVKDLHVGDRVILDQGLNCISIHQPLCEYCASGDSHQCESYREYGITGLPGGFVEYIAIPAVNAIRINSDFDSVEAALAEPLGCIVHASDMVARSRSRYVINDLDNVRRVRSILIFGVGTAGLLFTQYLRNVLKYDGVLLVVEPNAHRRELAVRFGAEGIDPNAFDVEEAVREKTGGRLVEYLIDACGTGTVFSSISHLIRKQSTVLLYGYGHVGTDLSVLNNLQFMEARLVFSTGASGGFNADGRPTTYCKAINLIESRQIQVSECITHRYKSLEAVPQAFTNDCKTDDYIKGVFAL